ncbi:hypothetical protein ACHAXR_005633 [Thalassiosira sp. AJA248-18]
MNVTDPSSSDPPSETNPYYNEEMKMIDDDRPLVCSNPSSYASSSRSRASSSIRSHSSTTATAATDTSSRCTRRYRQEQRHQEQQRSSSSMLDHDRHHHDSTGSNTTNSSTTSQDYNGQDYNDGTERRCRPYRRTLTGAASFYADYADPVESVAGCSGTSLRGGDSGRSSGGNNNDNKQRLVNEDVQLVSWVEDPKGGQQHQQHHQQHHQHHFSKWSQRSDSEVDGSGNTERLTDDLNSLSLDDDDEDICEEHYRRLPPPRSPQPQVQEQQIVVRGRNLEPEERLDPAEYPQQQSSSSSSQERQIVPAQPPGVVSKTSTEVVADIKNQLALVDYNTNPSYNNPPKHNGYQHCFITVEDEHKFLMLYTFLKRNMNNKVIIFFSTTKSTQYYARLLKALKFDARAIHNGQSKEKFLDEFLVFSKQHGGVLCVPDFQGKDLAIPPSCTWIVQFEPCSDPSEYIFRIGRISSENKSSICRALLFLTPQQFGFCKYYKAAKVKFYEYEIPKLVRNVQRELFKLVKNDAKLKKLGSDAYHAYLMAYASHDYRDIYNVHELDADKVALCFGFEKKPPSPSTEEGNTEEINNKGIGGGVTFQESKRTREQTRWKPTKDNQSKKNGWMRGEKKSWRYADVHADKMKVQKEQQQQQQQGGGRC